jgi:hypothetical protein
LDKILEHSKDNRTLYIAGSAIANSDIDYDEFYSKYIQERLDLVSCVIAKVKGVPPEAIIGRLVNKIDSSSSTEAAYALYALEKFGRDLLVVPQSLQKLQTSLKSLNHPELTLFSLIVLQGINDPRVDDLLDEVKKDRDYWRYWIQRRLVDKASSP